MVLHTQTDFPVLENIALALITVNESRGAAKENEDCNFDSFRKEFYSLYNGIFLFEILSNAIYFVYELLLFAISIETKLYYIRI